MSEEAETTTAPSSRWVTKWLRDEAFWRDIATRVISGLILAVLTWAGLIGFGYLRAPMHFVSVFMLVLFGGS